MRRLAIFLIGILCICPLSIVAQTNTTVEQYEAFKRQAMKEYSDFRSECNKTYAEFVRKAWKEYQLLPSIPTPKEKVVPPIVFPEEEEKEQPIPVAPDKDEEEQKTPVSEDEPIEEDTIQPQEEAIPEEEILDEEPVIEVIPPVDPEPQPLPIAPVKEEPQPVEQYFTFVYCGTECQVRLDDRHRFVLVDCSENSIAEAWEHCSDAIYNNVIRDCLELRIRHSLCDWAYLQMLQALGYNFMGNGSNEATLLTAYLYCQSGYKMRLARNATRLYLMVASQHLIFEHPYLTIDGDKFYPLNYREDEQFYVCSASFPKEQALSLWMEQAPVLNAERTAVRMLQSKRYPEMKAEVYANKNLLAYFDSYPSSEIRGNKMTCWAMYAQTPISREIKESLYPALRKKLQGLSQADAANRLLNFVQTAFEYEYDDVVWGGERALFAEESLHYPYCDCEDRSILYSHLVRDLLGIDVALVYYPGHLATAVCFTDGVQGDYLTINNRRFTICDPTYINAPIGESMPNLEYDKIEVIVLE